jgi:ribose transport system permease protein
METESRKDRFSSRRRLLGNRASGFEGSVGVYILLLALIVIRGIVSPRSINAKHLMDVFRQTAPLGVATIGQTMVLLVAGIDLSVSAVITLTNVLAASIMAGGNDTIGLAVFVCLLVAAVIGVINGLLVATARIPAFIVTLAVSSVIQGAYMVYTRGSPTGKIAPAFRVVSEGWIAGVFPWSGVVWLVILLAISMMLKRTVMGRRVYATGGNERATWISGTRTNRVIIAAYVISSLCAAVSGLLLSAYIGVASTGVGSDYTLNSIASSVIGGTAFSGGVGGLAGGFAGALIMVFLESILVMLNLGQPGKLVSQGIIIAVMMAINQARAASSRA